ncbi:MAG: hypothetical protein V7K14_03570 [Nostoc sp.]
MLGKTGAMATPERKAAIALIYQECDRPRLNWFKQAPLASARS